MLRVGGKWRVMDWEVEGDPRPPIKALRERMRHTQRSMANILGCSQATYKQYELPVTHSKHIIMPVPLGRRFLREMNAFGIGGYSLDDLYHPSIR